ncbi:MAG: hypothetical protein D6722_17840 [Bacteroidetes bacterium]|nr:MAG: hypothetical protein D6722_17840 [Bacteroidota bacterium]
MQRLIYLLSTLCLLSLGTDLHAQYEQVQFDYAQAYFNNGQPLPAESRMIFTGDIAPGIAMVEIQLFRPKDDKKKRPLYEAAWKRPPGDQTGTFRVPFNQPLKGNTDYDFRFLYYRPITPAEREALRLDLYQSLDQYVDQSVTNQGGKIRLASGTGLLLHDLKTIVTEGLTYYRSLTGVSFDGFSDIVRHGLDNLKNQGLPEGLPEGPLAPDYPALSTLKALLHTELAPVLQSQLVIRQDIREVSSYGTETGRRTLALNVGYGGVIFDASRETFTYDTSPYVGVSFPLANRQIGGPILSNTSLSLGVFVNNFTDPEGNTVTGPIFGRPYFLGLGYNFFRFIRLNAGLTAIEQQGSSGVGGGNAAFDVGAISLKPFIGLSAEIDLWLGLREKR